MSWDSRGSTQIMDPPKPSPAMHHRTGSQPSDLAADQRSPYVSNTTLSGGRSSQLKRSGSYDTRQYEQDSARISSSPDGRDHYSHRPPPRAGSPPSAAGRSDPDSKADVMAYPSPSPRLAPHRVDTHTMSSHNRRAPGPYERPDRRRVSPPPIATLKQSPSLSTSSLDQSSTASPGPSRRSPGASHRTQPYPSPNYYYQNSVSSHPMSREHMEPPHDRYGHRYQPEHRRDVSDGMHHGYSASHYGDHGQPMSNITYMPSQPLYMNPPPVVYTDDAATKLSDHVRRKCFNCAASETSTWRRSNLHPGKVLCNKCGLFERTHQRSRPDQFPHRRGPVSHTPPGLPTSRPHLPPPSSSHHHLPPISPHGSLPAYNYHPSVAPIAPVNDSSRGRQQPPPSGQQQVNGSPLPEIQSWRGSAQDSSSAPGQVRSAGVTSSPPVARKEAHPDSH